MLNLTVLVKILGVLLCLTGMVLCLYLSRANKKSHTMQMGLFTISSIVFYKVLAFVGLIAVPAASVGVANYHVFDGVKKVNSCNQCHVMSPMVNDMKDPGSQTLAARHFKHKWIPKDQCYVCHTDYGLSGTLEAKMDGYRHLARYTTGSYEEPIVFRGTYHNQNCLKCHKETGKFERVKSHQTVRQKLDQNKMSCLNCHGQAHPTRGQRTPGHPDYYRLVHGEGLPE